jgi:uncharacterized membrane protein YfcA
MLFSVHQAHKNWQGDPRSIKAFFLTFAFVRSVFRFAFIAAKLALAALTCQSSAMMSLLIENWPLIAGLAGAGMLAGLAAGLFGIGGGIVIVPTLSILMTGFGFGETAQHVAIATSLATIILTSARSVMAHHQRGAVDWTVLKTWSPWIMVGAAVGMWLAAKLSAAILTALFGAIGLLIAAQFVFGRPDWRLAGDLPKGPVRAALGSALGGLSALMGIGGGTFGVSLMTMCGRPMHQAIGTAAGFGAAIGVPSVVAAMLTGVGRDGLPFGSVGFVNIPAFLLLSIFTVAMAPFGARLAHNLDQTLLKRLFGVLLMLVAGRMLYGTIAG